VEGGTITSHEGNYEDYLRWKAAQAVGVDSSEPAAKAKPQEQTAPASNGTAAGMGADTEADAGKDRPRRLNPIKQKQMEERCAFLEEEIPRVEASIALTEEQLGVYISAEESQRLATLAEELRAQLAAFTAEWEELMMQLEGA
jgi:ATP-binding cassette subfamily F protein 3